MATKLPEVNTNQPDVQKSDTSQSSDQMSIHNCEDTLKEWRTRGTRVAFIYELILDKYRNKIEFYSVLAFILISMNTLLALGNIGLNDCDYPTISLIIKTSNAVLTTLAAIMSGIVRVKEWPSLVDNCQRYLDIVENFVAIIISEQTVPAKFRQNPEQFIIQQKDRFQNILNSAPSISHEDYLEALERYTNAPKRLRHDLINV